MALPLLQAIANAIANGRGQQCQLQLELATLMARLRMWAQSQALVKKCLERDRTGVPATENLQLDVEA